jgi:hypothetical protein
MSRPSSHRSYSRNAFLSSLNVFKIWSYISSLRNLSLSAPNLENTLRVAIKQGGRAGAVIVSLIKTINSTVNYGLFLISRWSPGGETVKESDMLIRTS